MPKPTVLFLCTGNSARSQIAEAWLRCCAGHHFEIHSAGLNPKGINPYTYQTMALRGIDLSAHRSKGLAEYLGKANFDYLITVCGHAEENCPIFPGISQHLHWPFEDPAAFQGSSEEKLAKFNQIRDQIEAKIITWLAELGIEPSHDNHPANL